MRSAGITTALITIGLATRALAQDPTPGVDLREWQVTPKRVEDPQLRYRLLPAEHQLTEGNAATILLRLPWDRLPFMNAVVPTFPALLEIPLSGTERLKIAAAGISFDRIYSELKLAAYRRTADWGYPLREEPLAQILLRDVQGLRDFQRGLSVWIRGQIASGDLDSAREGILVGMAIARHLGRTPFVITQMVAGAHVGTMLDRIEDLLQQPECPNLYWALTTLPAPIIDYRPSYELNRVFLQRSIEGLDDLDRSRTADEWKELADRVFQHLAGDPAVVENPAIKFDDQRSGQRLALAWARRDLPRRQPELVKRIEEMSDGEILVRWSVARHIELSDRVVAALGLDFPQGFRKLSESDLAATELSERWGWYAYYIERRAAWGYANLRARDRRIAALRIVEAVRHHAAMNAGKVPDSLAALKETPAPLDPLTGAPFDYEPAPDGLGFRLAARTLDVPKIGERETEPRHGLEWKVRLRLP